MVDRLGQGVALQFEGQGRRAGRGGENVIDAEIAFVAAVIERRPAVAELSKAAESIPDSARTRLQLGGALLQLGRLDDAERELLAAYRLGGAQMGGVQLMLGQIYFIERKYENARRAFEQYLTDVPIAPNAKEVRAFIEKIKTALGRV